MIEAQYYFWSISTAKLCVLLWLDMKSIDLFLAVVHYIQCFVLIDPIEVHHKVRPTQPINTIVREESVLLTLFVKIRDIVCRSI